MIKSHKTVTAAIYLSAATALSTLMLSRNSENTGTWLQGLLIWLTSCAVPLLFVFAYPVYVFSVLSSEKHRKYTALIQALGLLAATTFFPGLALPFWKNPMRDNDSIAVAIGFLAALCVFLVAALFLLIKKKSSLAMFASALIWPYWLLFALMEVGRYFQGSTSAAIFYFLCFITPVFLAFAAGAVFYRPATAHIAALSAAASAPWLYLNVMKGSELVNVWIVFNVGDTKLTADTPYAVLAILSVGLITLAVATSILRLLPPSWHFRRSAIRERTWPAVGTGVVVLTIWFTQSVMPYRIPGAVDRSGWLMLQILHVEKRGLQFHESCVSVRGWRGQPHEIMFAENHRRLFQYRFQDIGTGARLSDSLTERIQQMVKSASQVKRRSDIVAPIRAWNADRWYSNIPGSGENVNVTDQAPAGIPELFNDLEKLPRSSKTISEMSDVCLGFCYDPLSEMGFVYANDRCFNDGSGTVCDQHFAQY